jgi:hypothetical protein
VSAGAYDHQLSPTTIYFLVDFWHFSLVMVAVVAQDAYKGLVEEPRKSRRVHFLSEFLG